MEIDDPATLACVTRAFELYGRASMENDTATLDALFWSSARVVRYGVGENLYGADEIAAFRRARVGGVPPPTLTGTTITTFSIDFGTACIEYVRAGQAAIGRQTQTWVRMDNGGRIVAAHVSQMANMS